MKKPKLKKRLKAEFHMTARVYDNRAASILVRVPVVMTTIPEVPEVILHGEGDKQWAAVLISTNPIAYRSVIFGQAKKIK